MTCRGPPLGGCKFAKPQRKTALVAGGGVLLDDAPLGGPVNQGKRLSRQIGGRLGVLGLQQPPHGPDLVTQPGLARPVDFRPALGYAHALQRRYSVCHSNFQRIASAPRGSNATLLERPVGKPLASRAARNRRSPYTAA